MERRVEMFRATAVFLALIGVLGMAPPVAAELFGSSEVRSGGLAPFPKWAGVLERYFNETAQEGAGCEPSLFTRCRLAEWREFLSDLQGRDKRGQIDAVNEHMNRAPYIVDPRNYRVPDYWATPAQFLKRDGDCEDYAIVKFMSLRALGFANEDMRIVVLQDLNLRIAHAVLAIDFEGRTLILDNQIRSVVDASAIRHYQPFYSVNETSWWLYRL